MTNKNENVNEIDSVLEIFNTPEYKKRLEEEKKEEERRAEIGRQLDSLNRNGGMYQGNLTRGNESISAPEIGRKVINKSIGNDKIVSYRQKRYISPVSLRMPNIEKIAITLCSALIVVSLAAGAYAVFGEQIHENIQARQEYNTNINVLKNKAKFNLVYNGLATDTKSDFVVKDNSVDDYEKLGISNPLDVYIYSLVLPSQEFSKFMQSVSYYEYDYQRNYVNVEQFLRINGMIDSYTGTPSFNVFSNYMQGEIKNIPSGVIDEYKNNDNIFTYGEMLESIEEKNQGNGKGGK